MLEVIGTIGSLMTVLLLIVLTVLAISVAALVGFAVLAGSMADWPGLWRRLTRRRPRLTLKLSGSAVPARLRAELSGSMPRLRRRFPLGGAQPREGRGAGDPRRSRLHAHRPVERHTNP
ncbi:hypothetical protein [Nonomuraea sp. CA-141351]|uniref:hypothetical protein n=1 Tax=Nonomuraea sp. CA-141351 TaxID=3239996 RepID=UPI003D8DF20B